MENEYRIFKGSNLRRIRQSRSVAGKMMTQEELGSRAEMSAPQISRLESGRTKSPRKETIEKLAVALECDTEEFFEKLIIESVPALPADVKAKLGDPYHPEKGRAYLDVITGLTPENICPEKWRKIWDMLQHAIDSDKDFKILETDDCVVIVISNQFVWLRLEMDPRKSQQLASVINDEQLLVAGLVGAQITCLGIHKTEWSCDHVVGPAIQEIVADKIDWPLEDIEPRDSFYNLGATEAEAEEIVLAAANARGVSGVSDSLQEFVAKRYKMDTLDSWLMIPIGDVCEHIHRKESE